MDENISVMNKY